MLDQIIAEIHKSPWKGVISETGLGVPVQHMLTQVAGASSTIYIGTMPYDKMFQVSAGRAVSQLMAIETARTNWSKLSEKVKDTTNLFSLAITGAHKTADELGATHAWVALCTANGESYMHFSIPKGVSRKDAIDRAGEAVIRFLYSSLVSPHTMEGYVSHGVNVDVVNDPKMSMRAHLGLLTPNNPLLFHRGKFQRAASYIREYKKIYRGTFYPPTKAHEEIGKGALFEISSVNARKQRVDREQLMHSISILDALGIPVLITEIPLFIDFHHLLTLPVKVKVSKKKEMQLA